MWHAEPPLHAAVRRHDLQSIARLLSRSHDATQRWAPFLDKHVLPRSAIEHAAQVRCVDCLSVLARDQSCFTQYRGVRLIDWALRIVSEGTCSECVIELLRHGANPNAVLYPNGMTPLAIAAASGDSDSVEAMLHHGGNINHQLRNGATPLMLAVSGQSRASPDDVRLLINLGARTDIKDSAGMTALDWVSNGYRVDRDILCNILQESGCDH